MNTRLTTCCILALGCLHSFSVSEEVPAFTEEGFRVPQPGQILLFPRDHGSHPDYKIEWWYLTGHLESENGRTFGFQATFFRFAGPLMGSEIGTPSFGQSQLFSTQVAISDIEGNQFLFDERLDRNGWDAYASSERLSLRHGPWSLEMVDQQSETMKLGFQIGSKARLTLQLVPQKPKVIFGPDGTSRKGPEPTARSYYITFPRLAVSGKLMLDQELHTVTGTAWMDHEISSQQLGGNLVGWDWTAIQLTDGREIKAYLLRQEDGLPSPFSQLIWIDASGGTQYQDFGESGFSWDKTGIWKSPQTGTDYPSRVRIQTKDPDTGELLHLILIPLLEDQEVRGTLNDNHYWEGACRVENENGHRIGRAYLELAGYEKPLGGILR